MAGKMESNIPVAKSAAHQYRTGILTARQKSWTRARPNDRKIENPVLKKYVLLSKIIVLLCFVFYLFCYCIPMLCLPLLVECRMQNMCLQANHVPMQLMYNVYFQGFRKILK